MKIRNKKWILLCMLVFTLLLVTACAGSTALKDDLKNTTKKEMAYLLGFSSTAALNHWEHEIQNEESGPDA